MGIKNIQGEVRINDKRVATQDWVCLYINEPVAITAIFSIDEINTTITLRYLTGITKIDWGDGIVNAELNHTYSAIGKYTCKIYNATIIGNRTFQSNANLTSVVIGDSVTTIDDYAFSNCDGLTSVVIGDSVTTIGSNAFYNCDGLTSVVLGDGVTTIDNAAFASCSNLTKMKIPNSVTTIGGGAFNSCSSLTNIAIPEGITEIKSLTFNHCSNLTNVVIPNSVTMIGKEAFNYCSSLTSVEIGDSVTTIGNGVFSNCSRLTSVTFKNITPINYVQLVNSQSSLQNIYVPYNCQQAYVDKWAADGAPQEILNLIIESDREAMMSDVNAFKTELETILATTDSIISIFN